MGEDEKRTKNCQLSKGDQFGQLQFHNQPYIGTNIFIIICRYYLIIIIKNIMINLDKQSWTSLLYNFFPTETYFTFLQTFLC